MTRTVRAVFEGPTVLRLDEPIEFPLHVPVDVTISVPAVAGGEASALLELAGTLQIDGPTDLSERWEEYLAAGEQERTR